MSKKKLPIYPLCGPRLKELCEALGLKQKEFAHEIGVCAQTISGIVSGRIGISDSVVEKIKNRYPRVSEKWLRGDPDAQMNFRAFLYNREREALEKRHALESILSYIGFKIGEPYDLNGFSDYFYDVIDFNSSDPDKRIVAIPHYQMIGIVDNIFDIISAYMRGVIRSGMPADEFMDNAASYALSRLDPICADISAYVAKTDDEKLIIEDLNYYAHEEVFRDDDVKYPLCNPGETEDELKKKIYGKSEKHNLKQK